jgi:hypothetical protein
MPTVLEDLWAEDVSLQSQIGSHTHAIASITGAGTLASVTPTGTPDGTKFLRDDYSWQAAGGSGGDLALTKKAPASNVTVTAGYSCYVADEYELVAGVETEIGAGATLEIG